MANGRVVVMGASIGGVTALHRLVPTLPADFPAPILVVVHVGAQPSILPTILSAAGPLPAHHARDGEDLNDGVIYVAPPDQHLLVADHSVRLLRGAKEHHTRPAIDPLFLSAALTHGPGVVGVVMSGWGDDGTAGLQAIEKCRGIPVVQNPETAEEAQMPLSALKYVRVQHIAHLEEMGALLTRLVSESPPAHEKTDTSRLEHELDILLDEGAPMEHLEAIAKPSTLSCPDCKGVLWEIKDSEPLRYRCHVGHAFTMRGLLDVQGSDTEATLWQAIRALQERQKLVLKLASLHRGHDASTAGRLERASQDLGAQAQKLRHLVERGADIHDTL